VLNSGGSVAIGAVFGWQVIVARRVPFAQFATRVSAAALALFVLTTFGPGQTDLAFVGMSSGLTVHAIMMAHLKQRRAAR
jgi:hypothetical protein